MNLKFTAVLLMLVAPVFAGTPEHPPCVPESVQALAVNIQGKAPAEVREAMIKRFGSMPRHIGSGIRMEAWPLPEGTLVFNPLVGPTFTDEKSKRRCWLIRTKNLAGTNLLQSYEMLTLADASNHGNQFWLGDLDLRSDETYRFSDSDQFADQRSDRAENFFLRHPRGKVRVHYEMPISSETQLESLEEGAIVAQLIFTSSDDNETASFSVASSEQDRRLVFRATKPLSFSIATGWQSYWQ